MFASQSILIVEDEALIGHSLADAVEELGGAPLGPFATVSEASEILTRVTVVGAILDGKLLDGDVTPLACLLAERAVPIVIHSGTGVPPEIASQWPQIPFVGKPAPAKLVVELLCDEMMRSTVEL